MNKRFQSFSIGDIFSVFEIKTLNGQTRHEIAYDWMVDGNYDAMPCFIKTSYVNIKSYKLIGRLIIKNIK